MQVLSILGPTGTGKSAIAMMLSAELNGEIVSCDSMMVYRGMDIGTAKPSIEDRKSVKHHLIDIIDISQPYNAANYTKDATACIADTSSRNKLPILCGGTGLYAKALLDGYGFYPRNSTIACMVKNQMKQRGSRKLIAELEEIDPATAHKVKHNPRRLMRAVEIVRITRQPIRELAQAQQRGKFYGSHLVLLPEPRVLRKRIEKRTKKMLRNGWIEETEELVGKGLLQSPTAGKALGYAQIIAYLQGQIGSVTDVLEKIITLTCQYAKRQRTWFRNKHNYSLKLELKEDWNEAEVAKAILLRIENQLVSPEI